MSLKVSIITATYNSEKTLSTCMDSVISQVHKPIEYILVDGNSNDQTLEIIQQRSQEHPFIKWISEDDQGIYDALNKGIAMATGDIIGFVHSDDFLATTTVIGDIVTVFQSKNVAGVYGDLHYVSFNNVKHIVRNWKSRSFHPKLLNRGWMPAHPTLFLRQEIYQQCGQFDLGFKIAADYDFVLRVFTNSHYQFHYLPETFVKMRVGGASNQSLKNLITKTREDLRAARRNKLPNPLWAIFMKNISKLPQWFKK